MSDKPKYPECEKLSAVSVQRTSLDDFLGWLLAEKGIHLGAYPEGRMRMVPASYNKERLIMEFLEIDMDEIERERRQLLASMSP